MRVREIHTGHEDQGKPLVVQIQEAVVPSERRNLGKEVFPTYT